MICSLSEVPLFAGLSRSQVAELERFMRPVEFAPQTMIVRRGDPADSAFLVLSGLVAVRQHDPGSGVDFLLRELGPGEMFGEMAILTRGPRTSSVIAVQQTTCAILPRADFERTMREQPEFALAMTAMLADRLDRSSQRAGIDFINLTRVRVDPRVLTLLPLSLINEHRVLPIAFRNNRLTLAMTNPNNVVALDDVRRVIRGVMIEPAIVTDDDFRRFMAGTYPRSTATTEQAGAAAKKPVSPTPQPGWTADTVDLLQSDIIRELTLEPVAGSPTGETKQDLMIASEDAPIIRLTNSILGFGIKQGASDIHVEPMEREVTVRFRVDGVLQVVQRLPKKVQLGLVSRIKILGRLDIAEKRMPQDGRISVTMEGRPIDLRVSTVPGKWGEKVVMRILDRSGATLALDRLITYQPTLALVREALAQPYGIIYVTGPTGSGKTTTLYAALSELNNPSLNISTVEDPIEYDLPGVTQIQVNPEIGLTFAGVLRAFLRQDPDILLVGETRDQETAHTAVEAALTGHLVFTTLHTNNAAAAFTRLREMDIGPFLVSSSTVAVIAQRLARRLCQACREPYVIDAAARAFFDLPEGTRFFRGRGCARCSGKGLAGRIGIYEVMRLNPELRQLVGAGAPSEQIQAAAIARGMLSLKQYSAILLTEGLTTVEEVMAVVSVED
jgi:type IV pilus assembly protein PilB